MILFRIRKQFVVIGGLVHSARNLEGRDDYSRLTPSRNLVTVLCRATTSTSRSQAPLSR
jgi:hypothetical protein